MREIAVWGTRTAATVSPASQPVQCGVECVCCLPPCLPVHPHQQRESRNQSTNRLDPVDDDLLPRKDGKDNGSSGADHGEPRDGRHGRLSHLDWPQLQLPQRVQLGGSVILRLPPQNKALPMRPEALSCKRNTCNQKRQAQTWLAALWLA